MVNKYLKLIHFPETTSGSAIFLLFTLALALRLALRSPWLEDWDSVSFAIALHHFSLPEHFPHPPGYPLYVLLGRLLNTFLNNDTLTLTTISAFSGSLIIFPLYFLTKSWFGKTTAILAGTLTALIPIEWVLSESALTNMPGLFFLTLVIYFIYKSGSRKSLTNKRVFFVSFMSGAILGFRLTEAPVLAALLLFIVIKQFSWGKIVSSGTGILLGISIWLIPLALITGLNSFLDSYGWIANYVLRHDAQLTGTVSFHLLSERIQKIWTLLGISYTPYFILLSTISLTWLLRIKLYKGYIGQFLLIWLAAYLIPLIFIYNLEVTRYTLPLLPSLVILTSYFSITSVKKTSLAIPFLGVLIAVMSIQAYSQASRFHSQTPPTIKSVQYVKENLNPNNTLVLASYSFRQFQYYAPEFKAIHPDKLKETNFSQKFVVIDYIGLKEYRNLKSYSISAQQKFQGDPDIFPRIPEVALYILTKP